MNAADSMCAQLIRNMTVELRDVIEKLGDCEMQDRMQSETALQEMLDVLQGYINDNYSIDIWGE